MCLASVLDGSGLGGEGLNAPFKPRMLRMLRYGVAWSGLVWYGDQYGDVFLTAVVVAVGFLAIKPCIGTGAVKLLDYDYLP